MPARYVALLRGINVGGHKKVDMAGLRTVLADLGFSDVRTLLNSGNAVFSASTKPTAAPLEAAIRQRYGFDVAVTLRSAAEVGAIASANPFAEQAVDGSRYFVLFLDGPLARGVVKDLDAAAYEPELLHVARRELYAWLPGGLADSALMKQLTVNRLAVTVTARNWNTVTKLNAMLGA